MSLILDKSSKRFELSLRKIHTTSYAQRYEDKAAKAKQKQHQQDDEPKDAADGCCICAKKTILSSPPSLFGGKTTE